MYDAKVAYDVNVLLQFASIMTDALKVREFVHAGCAATNPTW